MKRIIFALLLTLAFAGCECHYEAQGIITDKATGKALSGVEVMLYLAVPDNELWDKYKVISDEEGRFTFSHDECSNYDLYFLKEGYYGYSTGLKDQMNVEMIVWKEESEPEI